MAALPLTVALWRYVAALLVVLGVLVGGTYVIVKQTTDYLLYRDATRAAELWANYLADNVGDLEQIAAGKAPSPASLTFLATVRTSGLVFRYAIYNRDGYPMLVVDRDKVTSVNRSEVNPIAVEAVKSDKAIVDAKEGRVAGEPAYLAQAYVPALVNGKPAAVIAAYVDLSVERQTYFWSFLLAAVSLCVLTALSFSVPAIAWYRRTREKEQADRRIQFLAHHDVLTGLANRERLIDHLEASLALISSNSHLVAVHFIDIDHFKQVNDTFGHDGGDFMLATIGERLRAMTRVEDMVARLGGDEFVVVQSSFAEKRQAEEFSRRLAMVLQAPMRFRDHEIAPTFTIGVAVAPADGTNAERLLKSADLALYAGKMAGRDCIRFFSPDMDEAMRRRVALEQLIRSAAASGNFVVHYQPVFEIAKNQLVGFEALVRLPGPDGALIPPAEFLPLAEELRLIDTLGTWVLREACRTAAAWPKELTVAVNLSPSQFYDGSLEGNITDALKESGLEPHRLELEITETLLMRNSDATIATLRRLKAKRLAVVMDDFGTGFSSLSYLWKFPFDKIKIDKSFMESFAKSGGDVATVVKTMIALGREMNMRVTVEGVETAEQVDFLCRAHADQVQGFYFGAPVPAAQVEADILNRGHKSADSGDGGQRIPSL